MGADGAIPAISVAVVPSDPNVFYAGLQRIYRSGDGGATWAATGVGPDFVSALAVAPADFYRSEDGGASWTAAARLDGERPRALVVDPENPWTVYVGGIRVWKSLNGGADWEPGVRGPRGAILSLAADPEEPGTLYAGTYVEEGRRLWKSRDGGRTWHPASEGISRNALVLRLVPDPAKPGTLYAATDRGVYVSRNRAGRWMPLQDGLTTSWVNTVAMDPRGGRGVYAGTHGGGGVFVLEGR